MRGVTILVAASLALLAAGCGTVTTAAPPATQTEAPSAAEAAPAEQTTVDETDDYAVSADTLRFMERTMVKLAKITRLWNSGSIASMNKAADMWLALDPNVPITTTMDGVVAEDFAAYADDVGYYMQGDGSVNMKQLDASRHNAEAAIAGAKL